MGGSIGPFDAGPDGWTGQIISGEKQSGHRCRERLERIDDLCVAQIVLRQSARVPVQAGRCRHSRDAQDARDFGANCFRDFVIAQLAKLGIRGAARKASEANHSLWRPAGEERGIEHRAEDMQAFGPRNQESKSVRSPLNMLAAIAR